ncbi:MAG: erythromycin esterase family protein, partial [Methylobacter sp.]
YGLDLYSLHSSIDAVLNYLDKVDREASSRARYRYSCFDHFGEDPQSYSYAASFGLTESCEDDVVNQLVELQLSAAGFMRRNGREAMDSFFFAEQNARLVKNAEQYYRLMFHGRVSSWNLRDRHMAETLDALMAHLNIQQREAKIVVWEHNSHLGDARATEMGKQGEWNVGQLVREKYGTEAVLVGFSTHSGTVTAASDWGGIAERKHVRPALAGSYEALFHKLRPKSFFLKLRNGGKAAESLYTPRLQRAIGVIYRPESERISHYFQARLAAQFDAIIHFDHTRAVEPLERTSLWERGELPETFPTGI